MMGQVCFRWWISGLPYLLTMCSLAPPSMPNFKVKHFFLLPISEPNHVPREYFCHVMKHRRRWMLN